jgi:hypothetical protein
MKVLIDRDSVCMGDDMNAHEETRVFDDDATVEQILEQVTRSRYLPCAFAVLSNRWSGPRLLPASARILAAAAGDMRIDFAYAVQRDPEALWDELCGTLAGRERHGDRRRLAGQTEAGED